MSAALFDLTAINNANLFWIANGRQAMGYGQTGSACSGLIQSILNNFFTLVIQCFLAEFILATESLSFWIFRCLVMMRQEASNHVKTNAICSLFEAVGRLLKLVLLSLKSKQGSRQRLNTFQLSSKWFLSVMRKMMQRKRPPAVQSPETTRGLRKICMMCWWEAVTQRKCQPSAILGCGENSQT